MPTTFAGRGLYAELPSPIKVGMQYFATDHGCLYQVSSLGQWTVVQGEVMQWNPMLGPGELIAGGTDGTAVRVPAAASDGMVLTSRGGSAGGVDWESAGGTGGVTVASTTWTPANINSIENVTLFTLAAGALPLMMAFRITTDVDPASTITVNITSPIGQVGGSGPSSLGDGVGAVAVMFFGDRFNNFAISAAGASSTVVISLAYDPGDTPGSTKPALALTIASIAGMFP